MKVSKYAEQFTDTEQCMQTSQHVCNKFTNNIIYIYIYINTKKAERERERGGEERNNKL